MCPYYVLHIVLSKGNIVINKIYESLPLKCFSCIFSPHQMLLLIDCYLKTIFTSYSFLIFLVPAIRKLLLGDFKFHMFTTY